jgi:nucleotide-binding universal stress UspA family protein
LGDRHPEFISGEETMTTTHPVSSTFEHILVPTDFSDVSQRALDYAKTFARAKSTELLLAHVEPPPNLMTPPEAAWFATSELESIHTEQLEHSRDALISEGFHARALSLSGRLYDELRSAIHDYNVDLIVLGTHGRKGLDRLLLGSDAEAMLRQAHCPVLSVGPGVPALEGKRWTIREILCPTTFDPDTAEVVAYARRLAGQHGAELVLFHVNKPDGVEVDWRAFEEAYRECSPNAAGNYSWIRSLITNAAPGSSIIDLAKQRAADLIVMGAHTASPLATHFGAGVVAKVLMQAPCPVMTLLQK